jgi:hypothetical protein
LPDVWAFDHSAGILGDATRRQAQPDLQNAKIRRHTPMAADVSNRARILVHPPVELLMRLLLCSLVLLSLILAFGCADPYSGRVEVTGTVKMKGEPILDDAMILFEPTDTATTIGRAVIKKGEYQLTRENGILPGRYIVRITTSKSKPAKETPDIPPPDELVPAEWNARSQQQVQITGGAPNEHNFDIP